MNKPDFMIIGVARGGTSSLFVNLVQHPALIKSSWKEIHYFDNYFTRGERWYLERFPETEPGELTLDGTPNYIYDPKTPGRVRKFADKYGKPTKFIVLWRDPVARAWSHFIHTKHRFGAQTIYKHPSNFYIEKSIYAPQLQRWLDHFDRKQFLHIHSVDFYRYPKQVIYSIYKWLGLKPIVLKEIKYWDPYKPGATGIRKYKKIPDDLHRELREFFRPHNQEFFDLLHFDLGWNEVRI